MKLFSKILRKRKHPVITGLVDFIQNGAITEYHAPAVLTEETLHHLINSLQNNYFDNSIFKFPEEFAPHHFEQNGCEEKIRKTFGFTADDKCTPSVAYISGYPVYTRSYVPIGEMWTCSKSGRIIKRVKLL